MRYVQFYRWGRVLIYSISRFAILYAIFCFELIAAPVNHPCATVIFGAYGAGSRLGEFAKQEGLRPIHIHPRDKDGIESLNRRDIEPVVLAIRERCPTVSIGLSTGEWIAPNLRDRLRYISEWGGIADFASVNFSETGAVEVSHKLLEVGVGVEAGLFQASCGKYPAVCG